MTIEILVSYVDRPPDFPGKAHFKISHLPSLDAHGDKITQIRLVAGLDWKAGGCEINRGNTGTGRVSFHRCSWHALVVVKWAGDYREELEL